MMSQPRCLNLAEGTCEDEPLGSEASRGDVTGAAYSSPRQREPGLSWEREHGRALTRGQVAVCISAAAWVGEASWLLFSASTECMRSSGISHLLQRCDCLLCGWFPDSAAVLTSPCSKIFSVKTIVCFAPFALSESVSPCGFVEAFSFLLSVP